MELFLLISTVLNANAKTMTRVKDFLMSLDCTEEVASNIELLQHAVEACEVIAKQLNGIFLKHLKDE